MHVDIKRSHSLMCRRVVMFRGVIPQILLSRVLAELEDTLLLVVEEPKISHFHRT